MDASAKQQVIEKLKNSSNILIAVSSNPSVDQLSAAIGFALMLGKIEKHASAVYSGETPSTLEFLKPEDTLQPNADSLQDFIISLDKAKADKLRYKVEDDVVRIFITPYRTSLSGDDLQFSQGDFNIDTVIALGVDEREHLDSAITSHGRILHDSTVITLMAGDKTSNIGTINWQEPSASSLCEMLVSISEAFQSGLLDDQISTAFLTGIVSETERFKNAKTTPKVMTMSAQLMAAGANQQLIADSLMQPEPVAATPEPEVEQKRAPADELLDIKEDKAEKLPKEDDANANADIDIQHDEKAEPKDAASDLDSVEQAEPETEGPSLQDKVGEAIVEAEKGALPDDPKPKEAKIELDIPELTMDGPDANANGKSIDDALSFELHPTEDEAKKPKKTKNSEPEPADDPNAINIDESGNLISASGGSNKEAGSKSNAGPTGNDSFITNKPKKVIQPLALDAESPGNSLSDAQDLVANALAADDNQPPGAIEALNAQPLPTESPTDASGDAGAPPPLPPPPTLPG